jgi:hypothetical protein
VVGVARELQFADVHEASSIVAAAGPMGSTRFDAMFIVLDDEGEAVWRVSRIRTGESPCPPETAVAVSATGCSAGAAMPLKRLEARRVLLKPDKAQCVLETSAGLWPARSVTVPA